MHGDEATDIALLGYWMLRPRNKRGAYTPELTVRAPQIADLLPKGMPILRPFVPTSLFGFGGLVEVDTPDVLAVDDRSHASSKGASRGSMLPAAPVRSTNFWRGDRRIEDEEAVRYHLEPWRCTLSLDL